VARLVSKGQQARSCCLRKAGRAICSWGGLDDVSSYGPGNDRVSCRRGTAKPDGPEYPRKRGLVTKERVTASDASDTGLRPVRVVTSVFRVWSCQRILAIWRWHFIWNASKRLVSAADSVRVSQAYVRTGRTSVWYTRIHYCTVLNWVVSLQDSCSSTHCSFSAVDMKRRGVFWGSLATMTTCNCVEISLVHRKLSSVYKCFFDTQCYYVKYIKSTPSICLLYNMCEMSLTVFLVHLSHFEYTQWVKNVFRVVVITLSDIDRLTIFFLSH